MPFPNIAAFQRRPGAHAPAPAVFVPERPGDFQDKYDIAQMANATKRQKLAEQKANRARRPAKSASPAELAKANAVVDDRFNRVQSARAAYAAKYAPQTTNEILPPSRWRFIELAADKANQDAPLRHAAALLKREGHRLTGDADSIARQTAEMAAERLAQSWGNAGAVSDRWKNGFVHPGGPVGGNPIYHRNPFVFRGLKSDESEIGRRFVTKLHKAKKLMSGECKGTADVIGSKLRALDDPYICANADMRGVIRIELDSVFAGWDAVDEAVRLAGVVAPNFVVGYEDGLGQIHNPHLVFILADSVCFGRKGRPGPKAFFKAAELRIVAALLPCGADPGGMLNPLRMKNPLSPLWHTRICNPEPFTLSSRGEGDFLPLVIGLPEEAEARRLLAEHAAAREGGRRVRAADHPEEAVANQSCAVFGDLIGFARSRVAWYRDNSSLADFADLLAAEACELTRPTTERALNAAVALGLYVAQWNFDNWKAKKMSTDEERKTALANGRSNGGRASSARQRRATVEAIRAAYEAIVAEGGKPTQSAVAAKAGVDVRTVRTRWRDVCPRKNRITAPRDKKVDQSAALPAAADITALIVGVTPEPAADEDDGEPGWGEDDDTLPPAPRVVRGGGGIFPPAPPTPSIDEIRDWVDLCNLKVPEMALKMLRGRIASILAPVRSPHGRHHNPGNRALGLIGGPERIERLEETWRCLAPRAAPLFAVASFLSGLSQVPSAPAAAEVAA